MFLLIQLVPLAIVLVAWELAARASQRFGFLFGSPTHVGETFMTDLTTGSLRGDFAVTLSEAALGLLIGSIIGSAVGLLLWLSPALAGVARPYIAAIASIPAFAIAPMTIFWFGTGWSSKVALSSLATVFVAVVQAYEGARRSDSDLIAVVGAFGGTRWQAFRFVVMPGTVAWVVVSCRLNVGFAILGAFVGEVIVSSRGLGHYIMRASGLYDVPRVLVGVVGLMVMSGMLLVAVRVLERRLLPWQSANGERETIDA